MAESTGGDESTLDAVAYVLGSKYRELAIRHLAESTAMPSQIAEENDLSLPHVSRALGELSENELVESHGQGSRTKLYSLTDRGEEVSTRVIELTDGEEQ